MAISTTSPAPPEGGQPAPTIPRLIITSPYHEPTQHWRYDRESRRFVLEAGRRPAGYVVATPNSRGFDDPGIFIELPLVNQIRPRVKAWREAGYPGATGTTKHLLEHWCDDEQRQDRPFFFCQLEAIETLIWLTEAPEADRVGIDVPSDGGPFRRLCAKMATGSGKTIVMAMLIAWQVLNKVAYPQDRRFSKHVFIVAPGLTVRSRLSVLLPSDPDNYYDAFNIVPTGMYDTLRQGKILVHNWHTLLPQDPDAGPKVVKKGPESDEAFTRRVLGDMATAHNLVVINDEAHHAWRLPPATSARAVSKEDLEEATQWVGGLDRLHRTRGILTCYDLSATPYVPTGKQAGEETLFGWVVSDFGLNDAIESGLVKTPRVVVRDDGKLTREYKSRLYHIYADAEVRVNLNQRVEESTPLPDLVVNALYLLGKDWQETARRWREEGMRTPPVLIAVANRTETAARVAYALARGKIAIPELSAPDRILHIDSRVLARAEAREDGLGEVALSEAEGAESDEEEADEARPRKLSREQRAERLRQMVDTVGQVGKPGEPIQCVISVGMLSEGWDAKTVTHIMGLRAFTSQLLCEQVVGRGLRRTAYEVNMEGLLDPDYVNVFGVPFTFLPQEGDEEATPPPPAPKTRIEVLPSRSAYAITWPNVVRIDQQYRERLTLDLARVEPLVLDVSTTATTAALAPVLAGKPDLSRLTQIELEDLARSLRLQTIVFRAAADVYDQVRPTWHGGREVLLGQVIGLVQRFIASDRLRIEPPLFNQDAARRRILLALNMNRVVQHVVGAIRAENSEALVPIFDTERPIRSTGDMRPWFTGKPCGATTRSHINMCVYDSTWEATEAQALDADPQVAAWAKNDHLGFEIVYVHDGIVRKYRPDFLVRLTNGRTLVLEVKGQDTPEAQAKRRALDEWVRAVTADGRFGRWASAVSYHPADVVGILRRFGS